MAKNVVENVQLSRVTIRPYYQYEFFMEFIDSEKNVVKSLRICSVDSDLDTCFPEEVYDREQKTFTEDGEKFEQKQFVNIVANNDVDNIIRNSGVEIPEEIADMFRAEYVATITPIYSREIDAFLASL